MRRAGFIATLAAGVGLLGTSFYGMASVDTTLKVAAATPTPSPDVVQERTVRDCDRPEKPYRGPSRSL